MSSAGLVASLSQLRRKAEEVRQQREATKLVASDRAAALRAVLEDCLCRGDANGAAGTVKVTLMRQARSPLTNRRDSYSFDHLPADTSSSAGTRKRPSAAYRLTRDGDSDNEEPPRANRRVEAPDPIALLAAARRRDASSQQPRTVAEANTLPKYLEEAKEKSLAKVGKLLTCDAGTPRNPGSAAKPASAKKGRK